MTRKEARDRQSKYDAFVSNIGQKEAARYLRSKEQPPTQGNIRAALAFVTLSVAVIVIALAL